MGILIPGFDDNTFRSLGIATFKIHCQAQLILDEQITELLTESVHPNVIEKCRGYKQDWLGVMERDGLTADHVIDRESTYMNAIEHHPGLHSVRWKNIKVLHHLSIPKLILLF
jgi:hypothetical protein